MTDDLKTYIGDAVYVAFDGFHVVLTTENGIMETNRICLDPHVLKQLEGWVTRLRLTIAEQGGTY